MQGFTFSFFAKQAVTIKTTIFLLLLTFSLLSSSMAASTFSLLFRYLSHHPKPHHRHRHFLSPLINRFSTSSSNTPKPSSLSSRLSFVFDKIDEIEAERAEKDEALQRIRAWRESKKKPAQPLQAADNVDDDTALVSTDCGDNHDNNGSGRNAENGGLGLGFGGGEESGEVKKVGGLMKREIELAHPWPEWVALMERLVKQNYFDHRRKDEDQMLQNLGEVDVDVAGFAEEEGFDFTRDWKTVHNAIVNFGKDRFDIFRSLSRQDIQTFVGYGCPSTDKKVVFSAKLLRKHAHLDEGDVCSNCSLRTNCERAYLVTNKEDEARTIDVMRVLLTYGFDPINGSVENKSLSKHKSVKAIVRKLLHEVVRLSAVPIDPNLPPPVIKKRPPKVKQPPPPPKRRVGRDDIEMKKGDWLCPKCNFMNFAKNSVCLQCDAKRPKRQLLPGEWECPQCNFLNYRRNMTCFNCEHKRPPDEYMESQMQVRQQRPVARLERVPNREQVSNAWNFDFDDDESDGADVAAFEYADARAMNEDHHLDSPPDKGTFSRPQDSLYEVRRNSRFPEKEPPRPVQTKHSMGFDDFDDDDDDVDSYELDKQNRNQRQEASPLRFSDVENEGYSDAESDNDISGFSGTKSSSYPKSYRSLHQNTALSDSGDDDMDYDSDKDLPVHPKWKSSHVADSVRRNKASRSPSKKMSFGSDDDDDRLVFGSDDDIEEGFNPRRHRENYYDPDERDLRQSEKLRQNRKQNRFEGRQGVDFVKGNDFDDEFGGSYRGSRGGHRGAHGSTRGRQSMSGGSRGSQRGKFDSSRGRQSTSEDSRGGQRGKFDNSRGRQSMSEDSHSTSRSRFDNVRGRQDMGGKQRGMQNFSGPRQSRAGHRGGRSNESDNWSEHDRPLRQR